MPRPLLHRPPSPITTGRRLRRHPCRPVPGRSVRRQLCPATGQIVARGGVEANDGHRLAVSPEEREAVLGWAPGPDTTPISNLVLHVLGAARRHLSNLAGTPEEIDRAAEFSAAPLPAAELVDRIEAAARQLEQYRDRLTIGDLLAERERPARELVGRGLVVLLVAYGHVTEHLAQIRLTKQL